MRCSRLAMGWVIAAAAFILSCGDDEPSDTEGSGGAANTGGGLGVTGGTTSSTGGANSGGTEDTGGSTASGGTTTTTGGAAGTGLPLGALCANDGNCGESADGPVVCCRQTCTLADRCEGSSSFLPCNSKADCDEFGGGKVCCKEATMQFCTKPSACNGEQLP